MTHRNGFLLFISSCLSGCGQMYQGYMKRGLSLLLAFCQGKGTIDQKFTVFAKGAANENVLTMLMIYILAGAFSTVASAMGGVDAIIFTAGVGENDKGIRAMVCDGLEYMGVKLDPAANDVRGKETVISAADSKVKVLLIPTNEELMIAMDTASIVKG